MPNLESVDVAALPQFPLPPTREIQPPEPDSVVITEDLPPAAAHELAQQQQENGSFDPWTVDEQQDGYEPGRFYVKTVLSKRQGGQPRNVQVPLDPQLHAIASAIVQQRVVPAYNTVQDLIRDAVLHRVHQLTHGTEGVPVYIDDPYVRELAQDARDGAREEMLSMLNTRELERVSRLHQIFEDISNTGNRTDMIELADRVKDAITKVKGANSKDRLRELADTIEMRLIQMNRGGQ
jgi:hypothetical protein